MLLMLYGTMWLFWADRRHYYRQRNRLASTLEDFGATTLVGLFLLLGSIVLVGWRARAKPYRLQRAKSWRVPISRTPMRSARSARELGITKPVDGTVDSVPSGSPPVGTMCLAAALLHHHHRPPGRHAARRTALPAGLRVRARARLARAGADHYRHAGRRPWARALHRRHRPVHLCRLAGGHAHGRPASLLVVHDLNHVYSTLVKLVIGPTTTAPTMAPWPNRCATWVAAAARKPSSGSPALSTAHPWAALRTCSSFRNHRFSAAVQRVPVRIRAPRVLGRVDTIAPT